MSAFTKLWEAESMSDVEAAMEEAGGLRGMADATAEDCKKFVRELMKGIKQISEYVNSSGTHKALVNICNIRLHITLDACGERFAELNIKPGKSFEEVFNGTCKS